MVSRLVDSETCRQLTVHIWLTALTQEGVRLAMNEAEAVDVERGNIVMNHEVVSPCVLMMTGMDFEEQQ